VTYTSDGVVDHRAHAVEETGSTGLEVVAQGAHVCSTESLELDVGSTGFDEVVDHGAHVCSVEPLKLDVGSTGFDEVVDHGAQVCSTTLLELVVGSTGLDDVVDHGAHVCSPELPLLLLVASTDCDEMLVLGHEPHSLLTLEVVASTEELDEPVLELGRPGCVIVVDLAVEVVSKVVLLPNG